MVAVFVLVFCFVAVVCLVWCVACLVVVFAGFLPVCVFWCCSLFCGLCHVWFYVGIRVLCWVSDFRFCGVVVSCAGCTMSSFVCMSAFSWCMSAFLALGVCL